MREKQPADTVKFRNRTVLILTKISNRKMRFFCCPPRVSNPPEIRVNAVEIPKVNCDAAVVEIVIRGNVKTFVLRFNSRMKRIVHSDL